MNREELDPAALILLDSFLDTSTMNRAFKDQYEQPYTIAAKAHVLRSVIQAKFLASSERYRLGKEYAEFGRVQFEDLETGHVYLLRSASAVVIEQAKSALRLFDLANVQELTSNVVLAVYAYGRQGLDLSVAGTKLSANGRRLEISGEPSFVGTWPFTPADGDSFDQRYIDAFEDLGDVAVDEEETGS